MNYRFTPEALREFEEAARYYAERQQGLELRFIESIHSTVQRILCDPVRWRIFKGDIRRCLAHVFPYAVLYAIEPGGVIVIAVMHTHREPDYWRKRVRKDSR